MKCLTSPEILFFIATQNMEDATLISSNGNLKTVTTRRHEVIKTNIDDMVNEANYNPHPSSTS